MKGGINIITILNSVLEKEREIDQHLEQFQDFCKQKSKVNEVKDSPIDQVVDLASCETSDEYINEIYKIDAYFDTFTDNEIKILQFIMYLGRDCKYNLIDTPFNNLETLMQSYFDGFELNQPINRSREINSITSKQPCVSDYFKRGFLELNKLQPTNLE